MVAWAQCVVCEFPPRPPSPRPALRALCPACPVACVGGTGGCSVAPLITEVMGGVRLAQNLSSPNPTDCYSVLSPLRVAAGDTLRPLGWTHLHALPHQHLVAPALPRQHQPRRGSLPCRIAEGFKNCTGEPTLSDSEDAHRIPPGWGGFLVFIDHWTHLRALPHQHLVAPMLPRPLRPWGWLRGGVQKGTRLTARITCPANEEEGKGGGQVHSRSSPTRGLIQYFR